MFTVKSEIHARQVESLSFRNLLLASDRQPGLQKRISINIHRLSRVEYFIFGLFIPNLNEKYSSLFILPLPLN